MIPVPEHLKSTAQIIENDETSVGFAVQCPCGCKKFLLYHASYEANRKEIEEWERRENEYFASLGIPHSKTDRRLLLNEPDGKIYECVVISGKKFGKYPYDPPSSRYREVYKAKCNDCGNEIIIFDSSLHGYDGRICGESIKEQKLVFKQTKRKISFDFTYEIFVTVENDSSYEKFCEASGDRYSEEDYSEGFSWIQLVIIGDKGKTKLLDIETA